MSETTGTEQIINTVCQDHCTNKCFLRSHVKDGKIIRMETDKGSMPQHRACLILLNDMASPGGAFCSNSALVQVEKLECSANR